MARRSTIQIDADELEALFQALQLWEKIHDERWSSTSVASRARPSWAYPGGTSEIIRHLNAAGYHVATTHRILMPDGSVPHWDCKDLHLGDIVIWCT